MPKPHARTRSFKRRKSTAEGLRESSRCRIVIIGVGGAGNNIVSRLMDVGITDAECIAVNTDLQQLSASKANEKVLIGEKTNKSKGADGDPEIGRRAAKESQALIQNLLNNVDVVFVTAGLGGGTGTGAAPIVAEIARGKGAVVVGVATTPFKTEKERMERAIRALEDMQRVCDTLIVVDNNKILEKIPRLQPSEAFKVTDQMVANLIKEIVETISAPNLINLDFADFKTVVRKGGLAVVGMGQSDAPNRAEEAVRIALGSPLFDMRLASATGALVHVSGDNQLTIEEANRVGEIVTEIMGHKTSVVWGAKVDPDTDGFLKVTLVMTGVHSPYTLSWLENIMPKLDDLESPYGEPEKTLPIDLGLDQIEDFEE